MRLFTFLIVVGTVLVAQADSLAQTWCYSAYPPDPAACQVDAIYCNDIDRICNGAPPCPPPPLEPCLPEQGWSWMLIRQAFPRTSSINDGPTPCGTEFKGEEGVDWYSSPPLSTRYPRGNLGQATVPLNTVVTGTDADPLILQFDMCGGNEEGIVIPGVHVQWDTGVIELFYDTGLGSENTRRSPMDFVLVGVEEDPVNNPGCISCYKTCTEPATSVHNPWPFVCQSYEILTEAPYCPPLQTNVRSAIAIGANALLDNNPCHCEITADPEQNLQVPTNYHLSYYDGLKWRIINPDHPGPGGETLEWWTDHPNPTNYDYFVLGEKTNKIMMTIKSSTVDIYHKTRININDEWVWVQSTVTGIKRLYTGSFNKMHAGTSIGCPMDSNGNCTGNRTCIKTGYDTCDDSGKGVWRARWLQFDNLSLTSNKPPPPPTGACCIPDDGSCVDGQSFDECEALGGDWRGWLTYCDTELCCVDPFADADADHDVDQVDFSMWQTCFSGDGHDHPDKKECKCFDRNDGTGAQGGDGDVDTADFDWFTACWSGPTVPAVTACDGGT